MLRLTAFLNYEQASVDEESRTIKNVVASTGNSNRNGWRANPNGWDLANYAKNPVLLWNHNASRAEPDDVLGTSAMHVGDDVLAADLTFESAELNPKAEKVFQKMKARTLRAVSVGMIPLEWHWEKTEGGKELVFDKQELMELSVVVVPADPDALVKENAAILAAFEEKKMDIDVVQEPLLDERLAKLCEKETMDECLAEISRLKGEVVSLKVCVSELENASLLRDIDEVLAAATQAGKVSPAESVSLRKRTSSKEDLDWLKEHIATLSKKVETEALQSSVEKVVKLTAAELHICETLGLDPAKFAEEK